VSTKTSFKQLRLHVVRPTLEFIGLWSSVAEDLVLGTIAQESDFKYVNQVTKTPETLGPAAGIVQMERPTHDDIWANFLRYRPALAGKIELLLAQHPTPFEQLATNLAYAVALCRILYYRFPEPLPPTSDPAALARLWKLRYNTPLGAGREVDFIRNFQLRVADV
jgi:hypothetical protein